MPSSCCPQARQSRLKGEGPRNLLFVPLLLRKYFLNSSFSFVYFYCSYSLPWFNPVLSYLFAFQTPAWSLTSTLTWRNLKKLPLSSPGTVFICLGELEGISVFWGYLCIGDSWAESYKLTLVNVTSGLNQILLLQIKDLLNDALGSDVVIYRAGSCHS